MRICLRHLEMKRTILWAVVLYTSMLYCSGASTVAIKCNKRGTMNSVTDFEHLTECTTFVDKTLMIATFFENVGSRQFQLITAPPKFGRTINLNMMKRMVEQHDDMQDRMDTYNLFSNSDLQVLYSDKVKLFDVHFDQYPTIYVSFKDVVGSTYECILKGLRENLKLCFESHEWLYKTLLKKYPSECNNTRTLIGYQVEVMRRVLEGEMDEEDIVNSLYELTRIIYKYFDDSSVFLIIDDYDSPVINAIENDLNVTQVVRLIEKMFAKLLHSNHPYIRYALIAGTFNVLDKAKFGHIKHWNFLDNHHFAEFFGFTEEEVDKLMDKHGVENHERNLTKEYYKGYTVAHSLTKLYNPFSIASYLCTRNPDCQHVAIENYWAETSKIQNSLQCFRKNKMSRDLLSELLSLKKITFLLKKRFSIEELEKLRKITHLKGYTLTSYHAVIFFSYLFHNGYLCHTEEPNTYTIPNREIESYLSMLIEEGQRNPLPNVSGKLLLHLEKVPAF